MQETLLSWCQEADNCDIALIPLSFSVSSSPSSFDTHPYGSMPLQPLQFGDRDETHTLVRQPAMRQVVVPPPPLPSGGFFHMKEGFTLTGGSNHQHICFTGASVSIPPYPCRPMTPSSSSPPRVNNVSPSTPMSEFPSVSSNTSSSSRNLFK